MARVEFAPETADDFERILSHLMQHGVLEAADRIQDILCAVDVLARNPLLGRKTKTGRRELVIGRASRGFVALYAYKEQLDLVLVLAIRGQKEAGYAR
jgi:toxin ParE1/3/4